jgi:putative transposase
VRALVLRLARESPRWGIGGSAASLPNSACQYRLDGPSAARPPRPASRTSGPSWREFLRAQAATIVACDFFTVESVFLRRCYVLFFITHASRRVWLAGCSPNPTGAWVGIRIVKTPVRAPQANAIAERFVRTVRAECLDWLMIVNRRHLDRVLRVLIEHYNVHRPHRALKLRPPQPREPPPVPTTRAINRRNRLGGLIHEYYRTAA